MKEQKEMGNKLGEVSGGMIHATKVGDHFLRFNVTDDTTGEQLGSFTGDMSKKGSIDAARKKANALYDSTAWKK